MAWDKQGEHSGQQKTAIQSLLAKNENAARSSSPKEKLWKFLIGLPYIFVAAIALFWPAHDSPLGLDFTQNILATSVPSISAYIHKSPFPHATAAYFVISAFVFTPLLIGGIVYPFGFWYLGSLEGLKEGIVRFREAELWRKLLIFTICPLVIFIAWSQPGYQYGIMPVAEKRWALALGGPFHNFYWGAYYFGKLFVLACRLMFGKLGKMRV